ncbi:MAG: aminotransferase class IV [Leptolyngbyaceae bacterium]|nr:aminotransferase class IV [Leptolyngbyaceae bacterium]
MNIGSEMFWYNGCLQEGTTISLSVADPGIVFGATVFTTLRVYEHRLDHPLTAWRSHLNRLQSSITAFSWKTPNWQAIEDGATYLAQQYPVIRITIFPDGRELITGRSLPQNMHTLQQDGVIAWLVQEHSFCRSLAGHKTGNYLPCWLALNHARRNGAHEAILTEPSTGNWLESSTGNLFAWGEGQWWTPPLTDDEYIHDEYIHKVPFSQSHPSLTSNESPTERPTQSFMRELILPGIERSQLISWLRCHNKEIVQDAWTPERISSFEFVAYCNSVQQLVPIHTVMNGRTFLTFHAQHPCLEDLTGFLHS